MACVYQRDGHFLVPLGPPPSAQAGYLPRKIGTRGLCSWLFFALGSCRPGPATGIQTVEMCGDKSPLTETVSLMSRIKNANDGLNCGVIKRLEQPPQTGVPMPCLWCRVLFMSRQLAGGSFLPWACRVGDLLHRLPPSQRAVGPNEGGFEVP